jgi:hypothetical protein
LPASPTRTTWSTPERASASSCRSPAEGFSARHRRRRLLLAQRDQLAQAKSALGRVGARLGRNDAELNRDDVRVSRDQATIDRESAATAGSEPPPENRPGDELGEDSM